MRRYLLWLLIETGEHGGPSDEADRAQVDRLLADEQVVDAPVEELHLRDERAHVEDPRVKRQDVAVRDAQRRGERAARARARARVRARARARARDCRRVAPQQVPIGRDDG